MTERKDENKVMSNEEPEKIIFQEKSNGFFENKETKDYLNHTKYKEYNRINKKMIKDNTKIKGQKYTSILKLVILINLFIRTFPIHKIYMINFYFSNSITLKVKGPGNNKIFCEPADGFLAENYPDSIYINDIKQVSVNYIFYLNSTINVVKLEWTNRIRQNEYMFRNLS